MRRKREETVPFASHMSTTLLWEQAYNGWVRACGVLASVRVELLQEHCVSTELCEKMQLRSVKRRSIVINMITMISRELSQHLQSPSKIKQMQCTSCYLLNLISMMRNGLFLRKCSKWEHVWTVKTILDNIRMLWSIFTSHPHTGEKQHETTKYRICIVL